MTPVQSIERPGTDKLVSEMVRAVRATGALRSSVADADRETYDVTAAPVAMVVPTPVDTLLPVPAAPTPVETVTPAPRVSTARAEATAPTANVGDGAEWRAVQAGAPVLMLSAVPILGSSRPGPILGPGMHYRILDMTGSVVGLEVKHANGDTRIGYANAVDLRCMEPGISTGELQSDKGLTGRLRLTKLATTTFGLFGG